MPIAFSHWNAHRHGRERQIVEVSLLALFLKDLALPLHPVFKPLRACRWAMAAVSSLLRRACSLCRKTSLVETNKYWRNGFVTFSSEKEALHVRIPSSFSSLNSSDSFYPPSLLRRHQFFLLSSSPTPFFSILPSLLLSFSERRIALPRRLFQPEEDFNVEIVAPRTFSDETLT